MTHSNPARGAVIVDALRTPIGRHRGALARVRADDLAATVIRALVARTEINPHDHAGTRGAP